MTERVVRAWRALRMREPYGVARPVGAPPCEPPAWSPVDLAGDAMDMIVADDGRSMWRVEMESGARAAYACTRGRAVRLNAFADIVVGLDDAFGGDPVTAWQSARDASVMLRLIGALLSEDAKKLAGIACARAVLDSVPETEREVARNALETAERAIREPLQVNCNAAAEASQVALAIANSQAEALRPAFGIGAMAAAGWAILSGGCAAQWAMQTASSPASLAAVVRGVIPAEAIFDGLIAWPSR